MRWLLWLFFILWVGGGIFGGKKGGEFKEVAGDETFLKFEKGLSEPSLTKPDLLYQKKKKVSRNDRETSR